VSEVLVERREGVAVLTLNAPERRNALTVAMAHELIEACEAIDADLAIGAVVVRGEGYFCAGGDRPTLEAVAEDPADPAHFDGMGAIYRSFARVGELRAPTVAAVHGGAVGAGFMPLGLHPGGGHGTLLGRTGSREAAAALMLFGERIDGSRAVELGLAWRAVESAEVDAVALELCSAPAADPELARRVAATFRGELGPVPLPWPVALELERAGQMWSMRRRNLMRGDRAAQGPDLDRG
jgi:enoyl-CoA hydratase